MFVYILIGKGTVSELRDIVFGEENIYNVLYDLQGIHIPVFLGAVDLQRPFFMHADGRIQHMLLKGWGVTPVVLHNGKTIARLPRLCLRPEEP